MKIPKRLAAGILSVFGLYGCWLATPGSAVSAEAKEIVTRHKALFAAHLKTATDKSQNAFYDPTFASFLGRFGAEYRDNTPVEAAVRALGQYSAVSFWGNRIAMPQALRANDPKLTEAAANFGHIYLAFHEMVKLPHNFPADPAPPSLSGPEVNLAQRSRLGLALTAYAEYLAAQKQWTPALETMKDTYRYVHQLREQDCFEWSLSFRATMAQQATTLTAHLLQQPEAHWTSQQLLELIGLLEETRITRQMAYEAMEATVFTLDNSVSGAPFALKHNSAASFLLSLPLARARDNRLFQRDYIPKLKKMADPAFNLNAARHYREPATAEEFIQGTRSLMGDNLGAAGDQVSNAAQGYRHYLDEARARGLVHLWANILLFRDRYHVLPTHGGQLSQIGYSPLEGLDPNSLRFEGTMDGLKVTYWHPFEGKPYEPHTPAAGAFTLSDTEISFAVPRP